MSKQLKLLKFQTSHCPQCKGLEMRMRDFDVVPVEAVDCEMEPDKAEKYGIRSVPTLVLVDYREEKEYCRWGNMGNLADVVDTINTVLDTDE